MQGGDHGCRVETVERVGYVARADIDAIALPCLEVEVSRVMPAGRADGADLLAACDEGVEAGFDVEKVGIHRVDRLSLRIFVGEHDNIPQPGEGSPA